MPREKVQRTPPNQWVRLIGGWSEFQFAEKRTPTLAELNAAAIDGEVAYIAPVKKLQCIASAMQ